MNLFRSEEHVRNWTGFKPGTEEGIVDLPLLAKLFSADAFTRRLEPDYISHVMEYRLARNTAWKEILKTGPFWPPAAP